MDEAIHKGVTSTEEELPGGLGVKRRARNLYRRYAVPPLRDVFITDDYTQTAPRLLPVRRRDLAISASCPFLHQTSLPLRRPRPLPTQAHQERLDADVQRHADLERTVESAVGDAWEVRSRGAADPSEADDVSFDGLAFGLRYRGQVRLICCRTVCGVLRRAFPQRGERRRRSGGHGADERRGRRQVDRFAASASS